MNYHRSPLTGIIQVILHCDSKRPVQPYCGQELFLSGSNSSIRLYGQAGSFSSVSLSQA